MLEGELQVVCGDLIRPLETNLAEHADGEVNGVRYSLGEQSRRARKLRGNSGSYIR